MEIATDKKRYISPEERQKIIDELSLVPKKDTYFQKLLIHIFIEERLQIIYKLRSVYKNGMPKNSERVRQCIDSTI